MISKFKNIFLEKNKHADSNKNVVFSLLNRISEKAGGVTKSVIYRSNALTDAGHQCFILLLEFDSSIPKTVESMKSDNRILGKVNIKSFFSHYADISLGLNEIKFDSKMRRTFDHIGATGMCSVRYYNCNNILFAEELLDSARKTVHFSIFINGKTLNFNSKVEAQTQWINEMCKDYNFVTLFSDQTNAPDRVANVTSTNVRKIIQIHGNHYESPYQNGSKIKSGYKKIFSTLDNYDAMIVLTESQKSDIRSVINSEIPIIVNPHPINNSESRKHVNREPYLAVVVSRIEKLKGIERIISNFKKVNELIPEAALEVWGDGNHMSSVENHVENIGASNCVSLKGYSLNPSMPMRRASIALFASEQEGFGLSLAEAVSLGTPVISTRTSYGAEDIIVDTVNGKIVDNDEDYVNAIIEFLKITAEGEFNHNNCSESVYWLSPENYLKRTEKFLLSVDNNLVNKKSIDRIFFKNDRSSVRGHVYIRKEDLPMGETVKVIVNNVNRSLLFHGSSCWLGHGVYEVHNFREDGEEHYAFQLKQDHVIYNGSLPAGCVEMEVLIK